MDRLSFTVSEMTDMLDDLAASATGARSVASRVLDQTRERLASHEQTIRYARSQTGFEPIVLQTQRKIDDLERVKDRARRILDRTQTNEGTST